MWGVRSQCAASAVDVFRGVKTGETVGNYVCLHSPIMTLSQRKNSLNNKMRAVMLQISARMLNAVVLDY